MQPPAKRPAARLGAAGRTLPPAPRGADVRYTPEGTKTFPSSPAAPAPVPPASPCQRPAGLGTHLPWARLCPPGTYLGQGARPGGSGDSAQEAGRLGPSSAPEGRASCGPRARTPGFAGSGSARGPGGRSGEPGPGDSAPSSRTPRGARRATRGWQPAPLGCVPGSGREEVLIAGVGTGAEDAPPLCHRPGKMGACGSRPWAPLTC